MILKKVWKELEKLNAGGMKLERIWIEEESKQILILNVF